MVSLHLFQLRNFPLGTLLSSLVTCWCETGAPTWQFEVCRLGWGKWVNHDITTYDKRWKKYEIRMFFPRITIWNSFRVIYLKKMKNEITYIFPLKPEGNRFILQTNLHNFQVFVFTSVLLVRLKDRPESSHNRHIGHTCSIRLDCYCIFRSYSNRFYWLQPRIRKIAVLRAFTQNRAKYFLCNRRSIFFRLKVTFCIGRTTLIFL